MARERRTLGHILVYSQDTHDQLKHRVAENLLTQLWISGLGVLSTQVLQEFYDVATRKLKPPLTRRKPGRWCSTTATGAESTPTRS